MKYVKYFLCCALLSSNGQVRAMSFERLSALAYFLCINNTHVPHTATNPITLPDSSRLLPCLQHDPHVQTPWHQDSGVLEQTAQNLQNRALSESEVTRQARNLVVYTLENQGNYLEQSYLDTTSRPVAYAMVHGMTEDLTKAVHACRKEEVLYFPKKKILKECLDNSAHLQTSWYHGAIIDQMATFLALRKVTPTQLYSQTNNIVLTELLRDALAAKNMPGTATPSAALNSALTKLPHLTWPVQSAAQACTTTKEKYQLQKHEQKILSKKKQRDWIHD